MSTINLDPWQAEIDELEPGCTTRVDHFDCSAGEDTRRRLYLTRTLADPNVILAWCHNCAQSGRKYAGGYATYRNNRTVGADKQVHYHSTEFKIPSHLIYNPDDWDTPANVWRTQQALTKIEVELYGIAVDPSTDRVFLPQYDMIDVKHHATGTINGYQLRRVQGYGTKYLNSKRETFKGYTRMHRTAGTIHTKVIIVEDFVSGIRVAEALRDTDDFNYEVVVNYGTRINTEMLHEVSHRNVHVIVWLDNDSEAVEKKAKDIARTAELFGCDKADVVLDHSDPKHYTNQEVRGVIYGLH